MTEVIATNMVILITKSDTSDYSDERELVGAGTVPSSEDIPF
jgi:hypothetical protein